MRPEAPAPPKSPDPFAFDEDLFQRKGTPERGDWLAEHAEAYQSYEAYVASAPVRPTRSRSRIVLQPLGPFSARGKELLAAVREHATIFFTLEVSTASAIALPRTGRRKRRTKLAHTLKFDPVQRYRRLAAFFTGHDLDAEAEFTRRLARLSA